MEPSFRRLGSKERRDSLLKCQAGILVTEDLEEAVRHCQDRVQRLARECREGNRKFRDLEFDLLEDRERCLHRLGYDPQNPRYTPADVRRVTEIVKNPKFFVDDATASDICQGDLGDCWFLSALAVVATTTSIIDKICVARDEPVGIYGFIFWRDFGWAEVIIDDLLCTKILPWNNLPSIDRAMFKHDKRKYNARARNGLFENLYFAKSKTDNETWVPLIEKAYAKLHGDYESLDRGFTSEGVEDLTGGVSTIIYTRDILNTDKFWKDELMHVGKDRLFACFTPGSTPGAVETEPTGGSGDDNEGLLNNHAYSITKAVEFESTDKKHRGRYLRIRNPWGRKEWSGPWSDGSEEWNDTSWTDELRQKLGDERGPYKFGDDGEFIQEYADFLACWEIIERSRLFHDDWKMSSQWLAMPDDAHLTPWSLGDLSFTVDIVSESDGPEEMETVIVLAQRDTRSFRELSGPYRWSMDFVLYRRGDKLPIARSVHSTLWDRSVKLEVKLRPGKYVIHARLDCKLKDPPADKPDWRKQNRKQMARAASAIIATNCHDHSLLSKHLTLRPSGLAGSDVGEVELRAHLEAMKFRNDTEKVLAGGNPHGGASTPRREQLNITTPSTNGPWEGDSDRLSTARSVGTRPPSILAPADSSVHGTNASYDGQTNQVRVESPLSFDFPGNPNGSSRRKGTSTSINVSRETTRYYTAPLGDTVDFTDYGGLQSDTPTTPRGTPKRGDPIIKFGGCVSNTIILSPVQSTNHLPDGQNVAEAEANEPSAGDSTTERSTPQTQTTTGSHQETDAQAPAFSKEAIDFRAKQLELVSSKHSSYRHEKFICRGCQQVIQGPMIHCIDIMCHDLNLCLHCKDLRIHPEDHQVVVSMCEEDDIAIHHEYTAASLLGAMKTTSNMASFDDLAPSDLLLGLRVYTRLPYKAQVKGQLRTGSLLRNHYFTPKPNGDLTEGIVYGQPQSEAATNPTGDQTAQ